jgi:folate-binding protein YgfZ
MMAQPRLTDPLFFDLSTRVKLRVTGADRVRFLNGQITDDIRKATETRTVEACVLTAKGKIDAHLFVHAETESFLLDADPGLQSSLQARLERYIIADDVEIADVTGQLSIFHVINRDTPSTSVSEKIISTNRLGAAGYDIWCDARQRDQIRAELAKNFQVCNDDCAEQLRIERGIPRWGRELTGDIIPVEANLEQRCIDYEKGCYIGQEVISRMKMSGQRNKQLCGLISLNNTALTPGMRLIASDGKDAGWITSTTQSQEREIALGFVKRGFNSAGSRVDALSAENARRPVEVVDLPFA